MCSRDLLPQHTITTLFTCMAAQERGELASVHISLSPSEAQQGTAGRLNAAEVCGHIMATSLMVVKMAPAFEFPLQRLILHVKGQVICPFLLL